MSSLNPPICDWSNQRVWVIGASSGIGKALADELLAKGARVAVSARRAEVLAKAFGAQPNALQLPLDIADNASMQGALGQIDSTWGGLDLGVIMAGTYRAVRAWELDDAAIRDMMQTNVYGAMNASALLSQQFLRQGCGHVSIVSSVAGYRGLPKAAAYGPTKAALINLAESLRPGAEADGVIIQVVNPGFVETPMTADNRFPMPFLISPDKAAGHILAGLRRDGFEIAFPWTFVMLLKVARLLPYRLYFALTRRML